MGSRASATDVFGRSTTAHFKAGLVYRIAIFGLSREKALSIAWQVTSPHIMSRHVMSCRVSSDRRSHGC